MFVCNEMKNYKFKLTEQVAAIYDASSSTVPFKLIATPPQCEFDVDVNDGCLLPLVRRVNVFPFGLGWWVTTLVLPIETRVCVCVLCAASSV